MRHVSTDVDIDGSAYQLGADAFILYIYYRNRTLSTTRVTKKHKRRTQ